MKRKIVYLIRNRMNIKGKEYLKEINTKFDNTKSDDKPKYSRGDSEVQERIMRLGVEAKVFGLEGNNDLETIAIATLKEDWLNNLSSNK